MVYEIFVRKGNGQVINELYKDKDRAIMRFNDLCYLFPKNVELFLTKKNRRKCCSDIKVQ